VKLLGIEPSGFNSTGDADRNNWFDNIAAHQEKLFRDPLETVSKIIQLDVFGEIDSRIAFDFPPLQEMSETEQAQNQKTKAETGKALIDAGVITAEEERRRVASDPNSGYNSIDPGSVPEPPPAPTLPPEFLAGQDVPEQAQDMSFDAEHWITVGGGKDGEGKGSHVLVDGNGKVIAGAGGKLTGRQFSPKSKSRDVQQYLATVPKSEVQEKNPHSSLGNPKKELNYSQVEKTKKEPEMKHKEQIFEHKDATFKVHYNKTTGRAEIEITPKDGAPWKGVTSATEVKNGMVQGGEVRVGKKRMMLNLRTEGKPELQNAASALEKMQADVAKERQQKKETVDAIPGISEYRKASELREMTYEAYLRKSDYGYPAKEAAAWESAEASFEKAKSEYPAAHAYEMAVSSMGSSNYEKSAIAKAAVEKMENGEDPVAVLAEMEKEWSVAAEKSAIND
jgi:hypothetical protein